ALVRGDRAESLKLEVSDDPNALGLKDISVRWAKDGYAASVDSGEVAGLVDGANRAIPKYLSNLNDVALSLATQVNALHTAGFDLAGVAGIDVFTSTSGPITAASIELNPALAGHPELIAASGDPTAQ